MKKLLAVLLVVTFVSVNLFAQAQPTVQTDATKKEAVKTADKKVVAAKKVGDAKVAADKKVVADKKVATDKVTADKKVATDKVTADKKVAVDKVTADKKIAAGKKVTTVNTNHAVIKKADAVKKSNVKETGPAKKEDSIH